MTIADLVPSEVVPLLTTRWLARPYHYYPTIGSTNEVLKQLAAAGKLGHGAVVLANFQQTGRGRLRRRWQAPMGSSLLLSLLVQPDWPVEQVQWLTMLASMAVVTAVSQFISVPVGIKWPNDMMLQYDDDWRKFGGILLEGEMDGNGRLRQAVLGIGLNVNLAVAELPDAVTPPTSLLVAGGQPVSRRDLLLALLAALEQGYDDADAGHSPFAGWQAHLMTLGTAVQVTQANGDVLAGEATAATDSGALLLTTPDGQEHTITAGDVTLRR